MKNIVEHRHLEYLKNLLEQYKGATGARKINVNDLLNSETASEFYGWLEERQKNTEEYKNMLSYATSDKREMMPGVYLDGNVFESFSTCEFGKGPVDSLVSDTNASVISPVADSFSQNHRRNKVVGELVSSYGRPLIKNENGEILRPTGINTYMTQNPYSYDLVDGLSDIHNSGRGRVVFGVYGSVNDKDRDKKLREFRKFADRFTKDPSHRYYAYTVEDEAYGLNTYFAYLISKNTNELNRYYDQRPRCQEEENERIIREAKRLRRGK